MHLGRQFLLNRSPKIFGVGMGLRTDQNKGNQIYIEGTVRNIG